MAATEPTTFVRGQLGRVLFSGSDVEKPIGALSGGEAARLIFGRIIVQKPNVLILDEPTNHLDLEAIAALIEGLRAFEGTVVFVSHDRFFVSALATRILEVTPTGPRDFTGTYSEYLAQCGDDHLDADTVVLKNKDASKADKKTHKPAQDGLSWEEQKKARNRRNQLPSRRDKVLASIEAAETRKAEIATLFTTPGFFDRTLKGEVVTLQREDADLTTKIEAWMKEWEEIEAELAQTDSPAS